MNRLAVFICIHLASLALLAQNTAKFPGAVPANADFGIATNRTETTLTAAITSTTATTITVASTSGIRAPTFVTIDNEEIAICSVPNGTTLTVGYSACPHVDGRGWDTTHGGGAAATHLVNAKVQVRSVGWRLNQGQAEIIAIAKRLHGLFRNVNEFSGADAGAKINACIADLPSTGGTCDARSLTGAQSAAATITLSKPVQLLIGGTTLTLSGSPGINITSAGVAIVGEGESSSDIKPGGNINLITVAAGPVTIRELSLTGASATWATATGISLTNGHSQNFQRLRMTDWGGVPFTITADKGIFMNLVDSLLQPAASATNGLVISGTDTTPTHRHFHNCDTGGSPIDIQGAETTIITNFSAQNITMTSSAKKLIMSASRFTSAAAATTIRGINHSIVGNVFAGPLTIDSSVTGATIGPNVTVGAATNNSTATDNLVIDHNGPVTFVKLGVGTQQYPGAGTGALVRPTTLTGTSQYGLQIAPVGSSAATSEIAGIVTRGDTAAAAFTVTSLYGMVVQDALKGGGSTITNQYGVNVLDQTQGTTNWAIKTGLGKVSFGDKQVFTGAVPTVSSCGTGASMSGTNAAGRISVGSTGGQNTCTVTFSGAAFANTPACVVTSTSADMALRVVSATTNFVVSTTSSFPSATLNYICMGFE